MPNYLVFFFVSTFALRSQSFSTVQQYSVIYSGVIYRAIYEHNFLGHQLLCLSGPFAIDRVFISSGNRKLITYYVVPVFEAVTPTLTLLFK